MNKVTALLFSTGLIAGAAQSAFAAGPTEGTGAMAAPKCAAGDKVVLVNTKTKMYSIAGAAGKASSAESSGEAATTAANTDKGGMARDADATKSKSAATATSKDDYSQMCKSKADAMGAKMMPKSGSLLNSKMGAGGH
ncbi:MAG: hypothetical protein M3R53_07750 [Candidatus Eremiobacteraeota bacterium]|nr:hypothetical protein [Candidatus Eremiobacteraeota bacterium]